MDEKDRLNDLFEKLKNIDIRKISQNEFMVHYSGINNYPYIDYSLQPSDEKDIDIFLMTHNEDKGGTKK